MAELDKINVNGELYDMSDSKARSDIASEITNRTNADKALDDKVKAETEARTSADNALNQKIVQETTDRTNADNALQEKINTNKTGIDNLVNDVAIRNVKAEEVTNVPEVKLPLDEVKEEIEAAGNRVLNSIPDDYTQINNDISELKSDLSDVEKVLNVTEKPSKNLIDKSKITYDTDLVNTTGGTRTASGWYVTDWIEVEPNTKYTVSGISSYYRAETDVDDYLTATYTGLGQNVATFTTGANTRFVRFNSQTSGYDKPQLELGAYATEYEEYGGEKDSVRVVNIEKTLTDISKQVNATKYVHISLDDCVFWSALIDNEATYTSCFENEKLAKLKEYHEQYGCVFTLNCFIVDGSKSIADVPSKFAEEFRANKDWLKFAFHGTTDTETYENDNVESITTQYNTFVNAIYKMTGDYDCVDRVTRLSSYTGSLNNVLALRDCDCGIVGLLTSDANGTSYYLDTNKRNYINSHCKLYDSETYITFIRTHQRLQQTIAPNRLDSVEYANYRPIIELFWHENNNWLDPYWISNFTKPWLEYVKEKGYGYAFSQDLI